MKQYFDPSVSFETIREIAPSLAKGTKRFAALDVRAFLQHLGYQTGEILRYCYRPFDARWLYWHPETKLLDEKRSDYRQQIFAGNYALSAVNQNRKEFSPPLVSDCATSRHIILLVKGGIEIEQLHRGGDRN